MTLFVLLAFALGFSAALLVLELAPVAMMSGALAAPTPVDRLRRAFGDLVRAEVPRLTFLGIYEYAVQGASSDGTTVDATPVDTTQPLPGLVKIPVRLPVSTATIAAGQRVLVFFVNGDPTRPAVMNSDPVPLVATVDAANRLNLGPTSTTVYIGSGSGAYRTPICYGDVIAPPVGWVVSGSPVTGSGVVLLPTVVQDPVAFARPVRE